MKIDRKTVAVTLIICALVLILFWGSRADFPREAGGSCLEQSTAMNGKLNINYTASTKLPAQVLNLTNWQVNLPVNANGTGGSNTVSITINQKSKPIPLSNYTLPPWFHVVTTPDGTNVVAMRANADGAKTSNNTKFPRTEFREMNDSVGASWSFTDGKTHLMMVDQAIVALSTQHPRTVAGQIHDFKNDVFMLVADGNNPGGNSTKANLTARFDNSQSAQVMIGQYGYNLGDFFNLTVKVDPSTNSSAVQVTVTVVYHEQTYTVSCTSFPNIAIYNAPLSGMYFKAGDYMQSNVVDYHELPNDWTEVLIKNLTVLHY